MKLWSIVSAWFSLHRVNTGTWPQAKGLKLSGQPVSRVIQWPRVLRVSREEVKRVSTWEPGCLAQTTPHPLLEVIALLALNFPNCKMGMMLGLPHWAVGDDEVR